MQVVQQRCAKAPSAFVLLVGRGRIVSFGHHLTQVQPPVLGQTDNTPTRCAIVFCMCAGVEHRISRLLNTRTVPGRLCHGNTPALLPLLRGCRHVER